MSNPRLAVLRDEFTAKRAELDSLDKLAADEQRDLTETERSDYDANVTRMEAIGKDIEEDLKRQARFDAVAEKTVAVQPGLARTNPRSPVQVVPSMGDQLLTRVKHSLGKIPDEEIETLQRVLAHGVAADGTAPVTIEGDLIKFVDDNRYAVNAVRRLAMPDNHAPTFKRPRATQFTTVAQQVTEGDVLSSQRMQLTGDTITKTTRGGVLSISEQEADWTDPSLLELAVQDLAQQYAIATDTVLTAAIVAAASDTTETILAAALPTSANFVVAISAASAVVYNAAKRLPDTLFMDVNWWARLIQIVDLDGRPLFPFAGPVNTFGSSGGVTSFTGFNVLGLQVVVDPTFAADTMIVANSGLIEFYEQNKGLLTIAAPSTLETQIAYRGYVAANVYSQGLGLIEAV